MSKLYFILQKNLNLKSKEKLEPRVSESPLRIFENVSISRSESKNTFVEIHQNQTLSKVIFRFMRL